MNTASLFTVISVTGLLAGCATSNVKQQHNAAASATAPSVVHVAIARDGSTTFEGKRVEPSDLPVRAHAAVAANPQAKIMIDAEREVSFQIVMTTVERLRQGGANQVVLGSIVSLPSTAETTAPPVSDAIAGSASGGAANSNLVGMTPPPARLSRHTTGPTPEPHAIVPQGTKWDCAFPSEKGAAAAKEANVLVRVHVETDGKPLSVDVLNDPGNGFGAAAKKCALDKAYQAARDLNGQPMRATTFPFYIQFVTR